MSLSDAGYLIGLLILSIIMIIAGAALIVWRFSFPLGFYYGAVLEFLLWAALYGGGILLGIGILILVMTIVCIRGQPKVEKPAESDV